MVESYIPMDVDVVFESKLDHIFDDTPSFWLVLETGPFASYTSLSLIMYF